ncbi:response regulator [Puniceicoccaceae bacterium K14]|nr:response regulator [Puniceicoccaceae bacterium K14]
MKKNVLLVEDDPALRMVMREVLQNEFKIDEAENGDVGIDKGVNSDADIIILDYHLPKKDGLEVIAEVKRAHPHIPVIVLTGYLSPESEQKFNRLGADKIFPKPFSYKLLMDTVKDLITDSNHVAKMKAPSIKSYPLPPIHNGESPSSTMLKDSLDTLASLAEKIEFLKTVSEKYWIEPKDITTIRETARCMEDEIRKHYGKINNTLFEAGDFNAPIIRMANRPSTFGNN